MASAPTIKNKFREPFLVWRPNPEIQTRNGNKTQNCSSTPRDQVWVNILSCVDSAKQYVDFLRRYRLESPNKEVAPVFKDVLGSGLNKQIVTLIINTKTDNAGTNLLIRRS